MWAQGGSPPRGAVRKGVVNGPAAPGHRPRSDVSKPTMLVSSGSNQKGVPYATKPKPHCSPGCGNQICGCQTDLLGIRAAFQQSVQSYATGILDGISYSAKQRRLQVVDVAKKGATTDMGTSHKAARHVYQATVQHVLQPQPQHKTNQETPHPRFHVA